VEVGEVDLVNSNLFADITSSNPTSCGILDGTITISDLQSNEDYAITYLFGTSTVLETLISDGTGVILLTGLGPGSYENIVVEELSSGCVANLASQQLESPDLFTDIASSNPTSCDVPDGTITISDLQANEGYAITYVFGTSTVSETLTADAAGVIALTGLSPGNYSNIEVIENNSQCSFELGTVLLGCEFINRLMCFEAKPFFTPNNDGINDTWSLTPIDPNNICTYKLLIFNRYGKLLKELSNLNPHWDGTYNGSKLPSSDYWFVVYYSFEGNDLVFSSHFSLKR
jgi:gliding motility-associated-like protein